MVPSIILGPKQWFNPRMNLELNGLTGEPRSMESKAYWRMRFFQATPSHPRCFTWCLSLLPSCHEVISFALPWLSIIIFLPLYHRSPLPSVPSDHRYYWNHKRKHVHLPRHFFSSGFGHSGEKLANTTLITVLKIKYKYFVYSVTERIEENCCHPQTTKGENQDSNSASKSLLYCLSGHLLYLSKLASGKMEHSPQWHPHSLKVEIIHLKEVLQLFLWDFGQILPLLLKLTSSLFYFLPPKHSQLPGT